MLNYENCLTDSRLYSKSYYNKLQGIMGVLGSLSSFNSLLTDRRNAFNKGKVLGRFVINGRFLLDEQGGVQLINKVFFGHNIVMTEGAWFNDLLRIKFPPTKIQYTRLDIPSENSICPICQKGWKFSNIHDYRIELSQKGHSVYMHTNCYKSINGDSRGIIICEEAIIIQT